MNYISVQQKSLGCFLWILTALSTIQLIHLRRRAAKGNENVMPKESSTDLKHLPKSENFVFMRRSESEFSLGFGRHESVQEGLMELGELCSTGRYIIESTRIALISSLVCCSSYLIYKWFSSRR